MTWRSSIVVAGLCALMTSCSSGSAQTPDTASTTTADKPSVVGKWTAEKEGIKITMEFTKDGTMRQSVDLGGQPKTSEGKYKLLDDKTMEVERQIGGETKTHKLKIVVTKDELKTTDEKGRTDTFQRVK